MLLVTGFVFCKFCIIGMPDFRPPFLCFLNVINYFLLLIKQMCFHQFLCLYRISAGNGIKQFPMFLHKIRALANIFHIFHAVTIELLAQIIDNRNKAVIVCCAENGVMESLIFIYDIENIPILYGTDEVLMSLT